MSGRTFTSIECPVLLLCTARLSFLEVWQRGLPGDVIDLQPLSAEAIEEFIEAVLGGAGIEPAARAGSSTRSRGIRSTPSRFCRC
jgi:predicted ATPase